MSDFLHCPLYDFEVLGKCQVSHCSFNLGKDKGCGYNELTQNGNPGAVMTNTDSENMSLLNALSHDGQDAIQVSKVLLRMHAAIYLFTSLKSVPDVCDKCGIRAASCSEHSDESQCISRRDYAKVMFGLLRTNLNLEYKQFAYLLWVCMVQNKVPGPLKLEPVFSNLQFPRKCL